MNTYKPTIGLEIHAELKTKTKMFCDSLNDPSEKHPNINICPVCMGHPGTLPVINKEAIKLVLKTGLALAGEIPHYSRFDRKNYFYPDLPKGYQISQYQHPLVKGGELTLPSSAKLIRLERIHLEEDTGRLMHDPAGSGSLVDFNRAGVPLMELVTKPDISSSEEASEFGEEFRRLLRYLDVSDADMEKGEMRLEANISLSLDSSLGTKVEVKNINSFNALRRAIEYEIKRQEKLLAANKGVAQETRGWDGRKQKTFSQRKKEESHDYRYFPEPDLPPLRVYEDPELNPEMLKRKLPELPWEKRKRFQDEYGMDMKASSMLIEDEHLSQFFEEAISELLEWGDKAKKAGLVKLAFNYLTSDLQGLVREKGILWQELLATPENFAELIKMVSKSEVSSRVAKDVLRIMVEEGGDPSDIVRDQGLGLVNKEGELEKIAKKIIDANPKAVSDYKAGKETTLQFLMGQVMRETKGSANPEVVKKILRKLL